MWPPQILSRDHKPQFSVFATQVTSQGSPLSPILYLYYNADLVEICKQEPNTIATGYIDDVAILRWEGSTEETCNGLTRTMQKANAWARNACIGVRTKQVSTHPSHKTASDRSRPPSTGRYRRFARLHIPSLAMSSWVQKTPRNSETAA